MQESNTLTRKHHPFSPSSLQAREACPKYQQDHEAPVHEMAFTGTMQHDSVDSQIDDPRLPDYRAMAVAQCIGFAEERARMYPGCTVLKEQYLPIDNNEVVTVEDTLVEFNTVDPDTGLTSLGFRQEPRSVWYKGTTAGYLDRAIVSADQKSAEIIDWKFGNNAVEDAENNLQGIGYALGLRKKFPTLRAIRVWFIMPHLDFTSEHVFLANEFDDLYFRVCTVVRRAQLARANPDDFSTARPNVGSCLFCGLIGKCPKVAETVLKLGHKYDPLTIPAHITPSSISDPAQVAIGIKLAQTVSTWAEAFRRQATAKTIEDPDFIPDGYTLVSQSKRKVISAKGLGELAKTFLPEEDQAKIEGLYDIAITNVEKLISTAAPRGQKEDTVKEFGKAALQSGHVEMGQPFAFLRQSRKQDSGKVEEK